MVDNPRILFLASWYPNSEDDQIGNFIQQHARAVSKFCEVRVLAAVKRSQIQKVEIEHKEINNLFSETIIYFKPDKSSSAIGRFKQFKKYQKALQLGYDYITKKYGKIDLTHINVMYPSGLFAAKLKKKENIPFIITEHWTIFLDSSPVSIKTWQLKLMKKIADQSSLICPVSVSLEKAMRKHGIESEYKIVPNGIDGSIFCLEPQKEENTENTKFLHVSTLDETHKNFSGMIRSFMKLSKTHPDFTLTLAGEELTEEQKVQIEQSGISDKIESLGIVELSRVAQLMQSHDAFVLFSNYETFSIVLAESLMCGLPVITSNVNGVAKEITEDLGIVVPIGDEEQLTAGLIKFAENKDKYNRTEIAELYADKYSQITVGRTFMNIYQTILSK